MNKAISNSTAIAIATEYYVDEEQLAEAVSMINSVADRETDFEDLPDPLYYLLSNHGVDIYDNDYYAEQYGSDDSIL